ATEAPIAPPPTTTTSTVSIDPFSLATGWCGEGAPRNGSLSVYAHLAVGLSADRGRGGRRVVRAVRVGGRRRRDRHRVCHRALLRRNDDDRHRGRLACADVAERARQLRIRLARPRAASLRRRHRLV